MIRATPTTELIIRLIKANKLLSVAILLCYCSALTSSLIVSKLYCSNCSIYSILLCKALIYFFRVISDRVVADELFKDN